MQVHMVLTFDHLLWHYLMWDEIQDQGNPVLLQCIFAFYEIAFEEALNDLELENVKSITLYKVTQSVRL